MTLFLRFRRKRDSFFVRNTTLLMRISCIAPILLISAATIFAGPTTHGQILKKRIKIEMNDEAMLTLITKIKTQAKVTVGYVVADITPYKHVKFKMAERSLAETLSLAFQGTLLRFKEEGSAIIIFSEDADYDSVPRNVEGSSSTTISTIEGIVRDDSRTPLPGVNVLLKGTLSGTTTNQNGEYRLEVPDEAETLVFSFIGFKTLEVNISGRNQIDVQMLSDITSLKEVVISGGYYLTTDRLKTGNIYKIAAKDIERQPVTNPLMALQGRVPGLNIIPYNGMPGGAVKIQIRGQNSLRSDGGYPLYIVNGVPIDSRPIRTSSGSLLQNGTDPLSTIDPENIESIEVLKDGDATAIYGSRGANGVILITTKRGSNATASTLNVNTYFGWGKMTNRIDLLNTEQYLAMRKEAFINDEAELGLFDFDVDGTWDTTRYTNWQDKLLGGTAKISDVAVNFSSGNAGTTFDVGMRLHNESTIFPGDFGIRMLNTHFGINHLSSDKKLSLSLSAQYGSKKASVFDDLNFVANAIEMPPNAPPLYNSDGTLNWEEVSLFDGIYVTNSFANPLALLSKTHDMSEGNLILNGNTSYKITPEVEITLRGGFTKLTSDDVSKSPLSSFPPTSIYPSTTASAVFGDNSRETIIVEPFFTIRRKFGQHAVNLVAGATWQQTSSNFTRITASGYSSDALLGSVVAAPNKSYVEDDGEYKYASLYARLGYDWAGKYLLNVTGRRDGSSRFGPGNRIGNFGAIGLGWVFSEESIFNSRLGFLSFGKLRGSIGVTGNDQIGDYSYLDTYNVSPYKYQEAIGLIPSELFNSSLEWEQTTKAEIGLELGFFDDRFFLEGSFFRNRSSNQLVRYGLPDITGFQDIQSNLDATVQNTGLELFVNIIAVRRENFQWSTSINYTAPRNKLISYEGIEESSNAARYKIGESLNIQRLYRWTGINPETGEYSVSDIDDDGAITPNEDMVFTRPLGKKYYGGFQNAVRYKRFELNFLIQFSKSTEFGYMPALNPGMRGVNQPTYVIGHWRQEGDITDVGRYTQSSSDNYYNALQSDLNTKDVSFLRLKTLGISYNVPIDFIRKQTSLGVNLFVQAQNLMTWTDYDYVLDPETGNGLPPLKMVTCGIQIKL